MPAEVEANGHACYHVDDSLNLWLEAFAAYTVDHGGVLRHCTCENAGTMIRKVKEPNVVLQYLAVKKISDLVSDVITKSSKSFLRSKIRNKADNSIKKHEQRPICNSILEIRDASFAIRIYQILS